jgi:hypothetical protein
MVGPPKWGNHGNRPPASRHQRRVGKNVSSFFIRVYPCSSVAIILSRVRSLLCSVEFCSTPRASDRPKAPYSRRGGRLKGSWQYHSVSEDAYIFWSIPVCNVHDQARCNTLPCRCLACYHSGSMSQYLWIERGPLLRTQGMPSAFDE